ncbi:hypothetical protein FJZ26_02305, partial [Candidatus Parvarchaeota archaeon]|nr:hypothetical protein [Candidatus Parvarchaeota archaeon]
MARCLRGQAGTGVIELFLASVIGWLFGMPFLAITLFFTMKYLDPKNTKKEVNLLGRTIKLRPILAYCILVLALS